MIEGRILISSTRLDMWIQQALIAEQQAIEEDEHWEGIERMFRRDGTSELEYLIQDHCEVWDFVGRDRELLTQHVMGLFEVAKKFLFEET